MASDAVRIRARSRLADFVDIRIVDVSMAIQASSAALQVTLARPEPDRVVRETSRAAIRPVSWVGIYLLAVFEGG